MVNSNNGVWYIWFLLLDFDEVVIEGESVVVLFIGE